MNQTDKAHAFAALHKKGEPIVLYNIWDAGGAKALAKAGAPAVATGSWSVAAAHGYRDGEQIPLEMVEMIVTCIAETVEIPLSVDFEGAYAVEPEKVTENAACIIATGAIGVNFEDRVVGGEGLHPTELQMRRIAAIRAAGDAAEVPFFINARTDLFLSEPDRSKHADLLSAAIDRAGLYREAGASGFFAPGLVDPELIRELCDAAQLPVNIMMLDDSPNASSLAELGVSRISFGPGPYRQAMQDLADRYQALDL